MANYPLVPDEPPPDELWTFSTGGLVSKCRMGFLLVSAHGFLGCFTTMVKDRVFALTIEPKKLAGIRLTP